MSTYIRVVHQVLQVYNVWVDCYFNTCPFYARSTYVGHMSHAGKSCGTSQSIPMSVRMVHQELHVCNMWVYCYFHSQNQPTLGDAITYHPSYTAALSSHKTYFNISLTDLSFKS